MVLTRGMGKVPTKQNRKNRLNYIGSKKTLLPFIESVITENTEKLDDKVFCDLFAGTGIVGRRFKGLTRKVISNDLEYYSYVLLKNYIENTGVYSIPFDPTPTKGFIYNNYCLGSNSERMYFTDENGMLIDGIRNQIEKFSEDKGLYFFLLTSLLESADKVANTASVYGAFLKKFKNSSITKLDLKPYQPDKGNSGEVYNQNSNDLIKNIKGDILYLDPPYNSRQYASNYHMLNTIAKNEEFIPAGKTGLPEYNRSSYSKKREAKDTFEDLIKNSDFEDIYVSYNNEGIISLEDFESIMKTYGKYDVSLFNGYKRFKADSSRFNKTDETIEYLHHIKRV